MTEMIPIVLEMLKLVAGMAKALNVTNADLVAVVTEAEAMPAKIDKAEAEDIAAENLAAGKK